MPAGLAILAVVLNIASLALLVYWSVGLARVIQTWRRIPTLRAGVALAGGNSTGPGAAGHIIGAGRHICIIIPAHNEQEAIRPLLESLKRQEHANFSAVLCLDRCTDDTAAVVREVAGGDRRFSILEITSCPEGWAGKVNALWNGACTPEAGGADHLLFIDADTVLDPACLRAALALMEHRQLDMLSVLSTLTAQRWFERLVQPAAGLELVRQYPIARANRRERRRAFANGQFMLFRRAAYQAVGGHKAVHDELLEDIALARKMAEADRPAGLFLADGLVTCRMYETWSDFRRGWKRIYIESARCKVQRLRRAAMVSALMGAVLPLGALVNLVVSLVLMRGEYDPAWGWAGGVLSSAALAVWLAVLAATYRIGRVSLAAVPGFIIGAWLVGGILAEAAADLRRGRAIVWGGRTYIRTPR
jgi:cellulose synthase/poly-beta-1,6-N-acetylglucosamine synthase-like glycosyltransferase